MNIKQRRTLGSLALSLVVGGCALGTTQKQDRPFQAVTGLEQFEGTYRNKAEPDGYLSEKLWANEVGRNGRVSSHDAIQAVQVRVDESELKLSAIGDDCVLLTSQYRRGREFELEDGRILLNDDFNLLTSGRSGDPLFGPRESEISLGLDAEGDGRYEETGFAAGLVFLVVPFAATVHDVERYRRLDVPMHTWPKCERANLK